MKARGFAGRAAPNTAPPGCEGASSEGPSSEAQEAMGPSEAALEEVLLQEAEALADFDRVHPIYPGNGDGWATVTERHAEIEAYSVEQEEQSHRRKHGVRDRLDAEGHLILPQLPKGAFNDEAGPKWGPAGSGKDEIWQPPPKPSKAQVGAAARLGAGDRASVQAIFSCSK